MTTKTKLNHASALLRSRIKSENRKRPKKFYQEMARLSAEVRRRKSPYRSAALRYRKLKTPMSLAMFAAKQRPPLSVFPIYRWLNILP